MAFKVNNFTVDFLHKTVGIGGQSDDGSFLNVANIKLQGTEHMNEHELEKHARAHVKRVLQEAASSI